MCNSDGFEETFCGTDSGAHILKHILRSVRNFHLTAQLMETDPGAHWGKKAMAEIHLFLLRLNCSISRLHPPKRLKVS